MSITKANFNYSMKNVPIPSETQYIRNVIIKTEDLIQRVRWATHFHLKKTQNGPQKETYGFKTLRNAPQSNELLNFETDLNYMIANLKFQKNVPKFQKALANDVRRIQTSKNVFVKADKTSNFYEMSKEEYNKLMRDNVTGKYKIDQNNTEQKVNRSAKDITDVLEISDRVETIALKESYITVKDHKPGFPDNISCRLINPTKPEIGKISNIYLERINNELKEKLNLRQLKNTNETLAWFNSLQEKNKLTFLQFDIDDFYPSVTEQLLEETLLFAEKHVSIKHIEKEAIRAARISVLRHNNCNWTKKSSDFDITMGAFDGAQVTDLVGLYILHLLKTEIPNVQFGIYRDDGLGVHENLPKPQINAIKKQVSNIFKKIRLKIKIEVGIKKVDFLDATLDLKNDRHLPFRKPNDTPIYINKSSNHPKHITENLTESINKRLSELSSTEEIFNANKVEYEEALRKSELKHKLKYKKPDTQPNQKKKKRNRSRNIIWYTPPFNMSLETNIGKEFLKIIDKNFPKNNPLYSILNRRTVKIGYSCTPNMNTIIAGHNRKILNEDKHAKKHRCNCKNPKECPMPKKCTAQSIVYKATIKSTKAYYIGMTGMTFKERYSTHKHSFKNSGKKTATSLAQYIHDKGLNPTPNIKWEIMKECRKYAPGDKTCDLCTSEKVLIIRHSKNPRNINKKNDLGTRCVHRRQHALGAIT